MLDGLPPSTQGHHWPHGITIVTPERRFLLACETESEQRAWMEALRKVVDRPMLPQEYAGEVGGPAEGRPRPCVALTRQGPVLSQWKPTSSTSPSTRRPRGPEDPGLPGVATGGRGRRGPSFSHEHLCLWNLNVGWPSLTPPRCCPPSTGRPQPPRRPLPAGALFL